MLWCRMIRIPRGRPICQRRLLQRQPRRLMQGHDRNPPSFSTTTTATNNTNNHHHMNMWTADPVSGHVCLQSSDQPRFQTIIGLEIHAQLQIPTKLFSPTILAKQITQPLPDDNADNDDDDDDDGGTSTTVPTTFTSASPSSSPPNTQLSLLDVAVPGSLPVLSAAAVHAAVLAAAALQCQIQETSRFERKHYSYADLPAGYQITQQRWPLAVNGSVSWNSNTSTKPTKQPKNKRQSVSAAAAVDTITCRIERLQLEQDTAKTTTRRRSIPNDAQASSSSLSFSESLVDFNRAGVALIEIVTAPDLRSSQQAVRLTEIVRQLLLHVGVCDGQLQSGSLRVDLNVNIEEIMERNDEEDKSPNRNGYDPETTTTQSLSDQQQKRPRRSPRVEVKNLNSLRQVEEAALYEARRQAALWTNEEDDDDDDNDAVVLSEETRTWNVLAQKTDLIRTKDQEQDYRFMPEPDLPPLVLNAATLDGCASVQEFVDQHLPELPAQALERLMQVYGLSAYQATVVAADPPAIHLLDTAIATALQQLDNDNNVGDENSGNSKRVKEIAQSAANLLSNELFALVKEDTPDDSDDTVTVQASAVTGEQLGEIVVLLTRNTISNTMAKKLLAVLYHEEETAASPSKVAEARGFELVTDPEQLRDLCRNVMTSHPDEVVVYQRGGKFVGKMIKLFTGKAMAASRGNAHPERLLEALLEVLEEVAPGVADE